MHASVNFLLYFVLVKTHALGLRGVYCTQPSGNIHHTIPRARVITIT